MKNKIKVTAFLLLALPLMAGQTTTVAAPPSTSTDSNAAVVVANAAPGVVSGAAGTSTPNSASVASGASLAAQNTATEQPGEKKFLVSVDLVQKALDDATAFVPIFRIDGKDRAVCFAGAKGAELVGYFMPGEALSDPATTCLSMVPSTKSVQKVTDVSAISGMVSAVPIQWGVLAEIKPDQIWFSRQQIGVCSVRGADGKVSGIGSFDLVDQTKTCYLNDRVASLNDPDIVVMLK